jgi:hypothetical protein
MKIMPWWDTCPGDGLWDRASGARSTMLDSRSFLPHEHAAARSGASGGAGDEVFPVGKFIYRSALSPGNYPRVQRAYPFGAPTAAFCPGIGHGWSARCGKSSKGATRGRELGLILTVIFIDEGIGMGDCVV